MGFRRPRWNKRQPWEVTMATNGGNGA